MSSVLNKKELLKAVIARLGLQNMSKRDHQKLLDKTEEFIKNETYQELVTDGIVNIFIKCVGLKKV